MAYYDRNQINDDLDNSDARRREVYWKRWNRRKLTWRGALGSLIAILGIMALGYGVYWFKTGRKSALGDPSEFIASPEPVTASTELVVGQSVAVEWKGKWYRGQVLALRGDGTVRVHYVGWDDKWDEDVPRTRLLFGDKP